MQCGGIVRALSRVGVTYRMLASHTMESRRQAPGRWSVVDTHGTFTMSGASSSWLREGRVIVPSVGEAAASVAPSREYLDRELRARDCVKVEKSALEF